MAGRSLPRVSATAVALLMKAFPVDPAASLPLSSLYATAGGGKEGAETAASRPREHMCSLTLAKGERGCNRRVCLLRIRDVRGALPIVCRVAVVAGVMSTLVVRCYTRSCFCFSGHEWVPPSRHRLHQNRTHLPHWTRAYVLSTTSSPQHTASR